MTPLLIRVLTYISDFDERKSVMTIVGNGAPLKRSIETDHRGQPHQLWILDPFNHGKSFFCAEGKPLQVPTTFVGNNVAYQCEYYPAIKRIASMAVKSMKRSLSDWTPDQGSSLLVKCLGLTVEVCVVLFHHLFTKDHP